MRPFVPISALRRLAAGGALAVALLAPSGCGDAPADDRWNVVLVSIDTLRADRTGAWGNPRGTSPWLDRWARGGSTWTTAVAQAASTLPSHRSLFRSRVASRADGDAPMLAEVLADAGWTAVAWTGGGNVAAELGFAAGFAIYEESDAGLPWSVDRFGAWLDGPRPDGPFFAFLHGYDVHLPYDPPPPFHRLYDPHYEGPVRGVDTRAMCRAIRRLGDREDWDGPTELGPADRRHLVALYDAGIRAADRALGSLRRLLEARGIADRTLVVLLSDHGEEFWDHGSLLHSHTVFQELVHVPLVVARPDGVGRGRLDGAVVRNLDVAPTVLDLLDLPPAPTHEGETLAASTEGFDGPHRPAVSEMKRFRSLLDWPWKLIARQPGPRVLFRLDEDPGEQRPVGRQHPARADSMRAVLDGMVADGVVEELDPDVGGGALRERLRALGYVD